MPYCINIGELSNTFSVPSRVADKLIKLSGAVQLKVLLVALNGNPANIVPEETFNLYPRRYRRAELLG